MAKRTIKIPVYSQEALETFLDNVKANVANYRECRTGWAEKFLASLGYRPTGCFMELPVRHLKYDPSNRSESDFRNAVTLYEDIRFTDRFQASSGLFWTFLSLENLEYLVQRNPLSKDDTKAASEILNRFCCPWDPSKRELARCTLASLWRIADLTVDNSRGANRYELTEEAFRNSDMMQSLTDRLPFMNRSIVRGVLQYSLSRRRDGNELDKLDYQQIAVHINSIAGSVRIDMLSESDIFQVCDDFMTWFVFSGAKAHLQKVKAEQNQKNAERLKNGAVSE